MSTNQWDDDDDNQQDQQQQSGKGLRAQLEAALARATKAEGERDKALAQAREATVTGVLKAKQINPKVAKLLPSDIEPTEAAITKWLEDYGDVFTPPKVEDAEAGNESDSSQGQGEETDEAEQEYAAQMGRIGNATAAAKAQATRHDEMMRKLTGKDLKPEELMEMIHAAGGGVGAG